MVEERANARKTDRYQKGWVGILQWSGCVCFHFGGIHDFCARGMNHRTALLLFQFMQCLTSDWLNSLCGSPSAQFSRDRNYNLSHKNSISIHILLRILQRILSRTNYTLFLLPCNFKAVLWKVRIVAWQLFRVKVIRSRNYEM